MNAAAPCRSVWGGTACFFSLHNNDILLHFGKHFCYTESTVRQSYIVNFQVR